MMDTNDLDERIERAAVYFGTDDESLYQALTVLKLAFPELFANGDQPPTHTMVRVFDRPVVSVCELPDGHVVVAGPYFPPHLWDGEKMTRLGHPE